MDGRWTVLTAIFSTLGMTVWTFLASALIGLPKQLAVVYIGVSQANNGEWGVGISV